MAATLITAASAAEGTAEELYARAEKVMKRDLPVYDYEKVFWNSMFSVGIIGVGYASLKLGRMMVALTSALNNLDILGWIPNEAVESMENIDKNILAPIDNVAMSLAPLAPIGAVGLQASFEYTKKRKFMSKYERLTGDVALGIAAMVAVQQLPALLKINWNALLSPVAAGKGKMDIKASDLPTIGSPVQLEDGYWLSHIEDYKGYYLLEYYDANKEYGHLYAWSPQLEVNVKDMIILTPKTYPFNLEMTMARYAKWQKTVDEMKAWIDTFGGQSGQGGVG